jgi:glutamate N-acetyltransferase/amino-acid N-acetyltransferase
VKLPAGYKYASVYAGIRKDKRHDLGLIVSSTPASAAAVFTQNRVQAAPVRIARFNLAKSRGRVSAALVNAGNANCATRTGDRVAIACCDAVSKHLRVAAEEVLPASTGVIGVELEASLITNALPGLVERLSPKRFEDVARAILTTDTRMKVAYAQVRLKSGTIRMAGMTKGAGMIQPNMATTLGFVMMDAAIPPAALSSMLAGGVARSYNRISIDGDTSTNDTLLVLANGASGVQPNDKERSKVSEALTGVLEDLARQIARDGEGARKLITIDVRGAAGDEAAERIARSIANSPLVKTAIHGGDPNWGRLIAAAGRSGAAFDLNRASVSIGSVPLFTSGVPHDERADDAAKVLAAKEMAITVDLGTGGRHDATMWTCDFSADYVRINAEYRT